MTQARDLTLMCGRHQLHVIRLCRDGDMVAVNHPNLAAEVTMAGLSGEPAPICAEAIDFYEATQFTHPAHSLMTAWTWHHVFHGGGVPMRREPR